MKEYGLSDEELKALGEKTVASGKNLLLGGKSEPCLLYTSPSPRDS